MTQADLTPNWTNVIVGFIVFGGMIVCLTLLLRVFIKNRHKRDELEKGAELQDWKQTYWDNEQEFFDKK